MQHTDRIVIVGAGYTGLEIARQARARGLEVVGTSRAQATLAQLAALGARGVRWDVHADPIDALAAHLGPRTAVVYSVPPLDAPLDLPDHVAPLDAPLDQPDHVAPVARVLEAAVAAGVERFVYLSSTAVYGDHGGAWIDEDSERRPDSPAGHRRRDIEDYVLAQAARIAPFVARIVGIYGPGRTMVERIASGRYTLVDGGHKPTNRIHVEDLASSVLAMIERGPRGGRAYLVCDGAPVTVRAFVELVCERAGLERPREESLEAYAARVRNPDAVGRWKSAVRCRNTRLRDELGVELRYPDVFAGYEALIPSR